MKVETEELTVSDLAALLVVASNKEVDDFNGLYDQLEAANKRIEEQDQIILKDRALLQKQEVVIHAAVEVKKTDNAQLNVLRAQLQELQRLDAKRLTKVNKTQKATIVELKDKLATVEAARKSAVKIAKTVKSGAKTEGNAAFHFDPVTNNALRILPGLHVSKDNEFNGVPGSPVIEFLHHARGITRQGVLLNDGIVSWANAKNSTPTIDESTVAREFLLSWCKTNKIKVKTN